MPASPPGAASPLQRHDSHGFPACPPGLGEALPVGAWTSPRHERGSTEHVPVAELAHRQGVSPAASLDDLARPDLFESEEELDEFLAMVYADRHSP